MHNNIAKTKIDENWEHLFQQYRIVERVKAAGVFHISSAQINEVHEARLMAKFDQSIQLPQIFQDHKLSILPVAKGEYVIGTFKTHHIIPYPDKIVKPVYVATPPLETLDYTNLYSEASALFFAYNSGIIENILGSNQVAFTVNGRMSSGRFSFTIENTVDVEKRMSIGVNNAQIEIDAGYESPDAFCICEAKNQTVTEMLIRQLYYPYRLWSEKISKPVIPVFFVFSNDIFHVFTYSFQDKQDYNSIELKNYNTYTFSDDEISLQEVVGLWKRTPIVTEPLITFPQADSFARVLDLLSVLYESPLTRNEVTLKYEFDSRQTNYYISACEYLGFVEKGNTQDGEREYRLSADAHRILSLAYKEKYLALIQRILEKPVFHQSFEIYLQSCQQPDKQVICRIMSGANLKINETTIGRRASTVSGWLDWVLRQTTAD
ncbi:hypothetical protein FACS189454_08580 [Planctomycetales bacterium]|nr:hypothetical protein FACS189454_08580 [Planctomycetales bacterium]